MKSKRIWVIAGTVVAVLAVACVGGLIWHEQPSFCNAICHTPMDGYLETLTATPGESATDKYGNEVSDASSMLAATHYSEDGVTCLDCHVPTLSEQLSEASAWVTGDYTVYTTEDGGYVPTEKSLSDLVEASGSTEDSFCLNEDCHDVTREDLAELTSYMVRNVHIAQHGVVACSECHKSHRASVNYCSECHADATIPDGWVSYNESKQILAAASS